MIALSVSDVSLSFGMETVLKNISFSVNDGDRVGVIGVNGAGKTSLFRVITGEYNVDNSPELANRFGISSIPTIIVMKNGKIANQAVGFRTKDQLLALL